ncbi:type VI secretion system tip protein VgrG [Roseivirga thermotolerans]|uniref:Type IV secretion protein Rhs n=1 Tax=Roseivirga thermotolerans TaxID=1758176 RepID=A0ABQ3I4N4_9BACT|nr:type VI secretion system tip protein VgrG [Roseivirga thermotolerans]GHE63698.1 type IV secretion protein Rhs [Roseivirga thermotolerans]
MPSAPVSSETYLITYQVLANGSPIDSTYNVTSINIQKEVNKIATCEIVVLDGSASQEDFPISDSDTFVPGTSIEVKMGYESHNETVFKGIVLRQGLRVMGGQGPVLEVVCKDEAVKMTVGRKNAYYKDTTDSDAISKVIGNYGGLTADVSSTSGQLPEIVQYYATDWDFILSRAEFNGMIVTTESGKVSVKDPDSETTEVLEVVYGQDILDFDASVDALNQYKSVKANAWDMKNQQIISGQSSLSDYSQGNISNSKLAEVIGLSDFELQSTAPLDSGSLNTWAKAQTTKSKYAKIRGSVSFQGNAKALPGTLISIGGMGGRFNGKAFISGVEHKLSAGNWITEVQMGISPDWFTSQVRMQAPLASGQLPGIQGLQNGTVKQINEDPDGEFRVLVDVPIIAPGGDGVWARYANFYATNEAGSFFYPEVGDEVVLGFLNDDPRYPIVLGSLYNSNSKNAPYTPDETNSTKAIVTKNKLKLIFDDENKVVTIITPGENQMVWSDQDQSITIKDQNENSIEMSSSGITIKSASSMTLQAAESITMKAGESVTVQGGESVSIQGASISAQADMEASIEGGTSTSISGGTEVSISGAMVMIN